MSVQCLPNVVQTSMMFGQRWVDVVPTSRDQWEISVVASSYYDKMKRAENAEQNKNGSNGKKFHFP